MQSPLEVSIPHADIWLYHSGLWTNGCLHAHTLLLSVQNHGQNDA